MVLPQIVCHRRRAGPARFRLSGLRLGAGLRRVAEEAGWAVKKLDYMNAAGALGWWVNAHILKREAQSERQIAVFDRYVVPVMSAVEAAMKPVFGQSLFAVLEKE